MNSPKNTVNPTVNCSDVYIRFLFSFFSLMLQMSLSRSREFEADRGGAELCGSGRGLASALRKIENYAHQVPMDIDPAQASAYIVNPLSGRKVQFAKLFTTHPPTEVRIERLLAM